MPYPEEDKKGKSEPIPDSDNEEPDNDQIDEALEETFPASDPPAFHRRRDEGGKHEA